MNHAPALTVLTAPAVPALVTAAGDRAGVRFLEFFASAIHNPHTRRAYARAASDFLGWCASAGLLSITDVQPLHVAAWIELQTTTHGAPTVKQRLAAIRHLFDWLVTGQVVPHNPAASERGLPTRRAPAPRPYWIPPRRGSCSTALMGAHRSGCGTAR